MLSIKQCQQILEKSGVKYNKEEVFKVWDFLYEMALLDFQNLKDIQAKAKGKSSDMPQGFDK